MENTKALLLLTTLLTLSGCAISKNVVPVDSGTTIKKIYVLENERVHMEGLVDELVTQIANMGFDSEKYSGDRPEDAKHYLTYTANWQWDMAMYLTYFEATLYEDGRVLGEVSYDAKMGGANMNKFGKTADKVKPLLLELLAKVNRGSEVPKLGNEQKQPTTKGPSHRSFALPFLPRYRSWLRPVSHQSGTADPPLDTPSIRVTDMGILKMHLPWYLKVLALSPQFFTLQFPSIFPQRLGFRADQSSQAFRRGTHTDP